MEVRLIPMSFKDKVIKGKNITQIQQDFFVKYLKETNPIYRFITGINASQNDLFLFQLDSKIIASALLDNIKYYDLPDAEGYRGEYSFFQNSIRVFDPITANELKNYCHDFNRFNQSKQVLKIDNLKKLIDRIDQGKNNKIKKLSRSNKYTRKDIHDIFSPNTNFTPQAGSWGLHGIIRVPDTKHDYIFLVTYGQSQSGHDFNESIDENGILTWQSQPSQGFDDARINDFINHDYLKNNIYLFLRKSSNELYSYMGKLAYVEHDNQREKPVYFKWQILDWNIDNLDNGKKFEKENDNINYSNNNIKIEEFKLTLYDKRSTYHSVERKGKCTSEFNNKSYNFEGNVEKNTKLGNIGEDIVVEYEKKHLISIERLDLAEQVIATRNFAGNAERFDVLSFEDDGTEKYIEVKTTTGGINNIFHISENEVVFSEEFSDKYYLYRLYNLNLKKREADLIIIKGALDRKMLEPTNYVCKIRLEIEEK